MRNFEELQKIIEQWAKDKSLLHAENADKQFMKFIEEVFEFKVELDFYKYFKSFKHTNIEVDYSIETVDKYNKLQLEMGDIFVTLIVLCRQIGIEPTRCLDMAYEKIKDRTGKTIDGVFVKEEDLRGAR
ncbi:hypothetical protein HMPREF1143_1738 [Peptoanaerobacter stomatis]|uniref:MazG nucleotide pyrophosphohydrolase domain protein n=1 Tax=Peptoanaerobacter stomatis TaxID=796937 RepID=J5UH94_9FIRM|nr:MazG-like family protein [Peptoanaerobacter stomatis]EJU22534.1 hypothetical protein HMPREF1143_1738 [Peptoanaerobacter stomatis]